MIIRSLAILRRYFNPRSHEGSDKQCRTGNRLVNDFNPRSHEGSDDPFRPIQPHIIRFQSALPRGERPVYCSCLPCQSGFQSALPRGERHYLTLTLSYIVDFNPRSHERSDTFACHSGFIYADFNPRSHEGSDTDNRVIPTQERISIRAPTRGATSFAFNCGTGNLFQSALPRGERHSPGTLTWGSDKFQSALPRGERLCCSQRRIFAD